MNWRWRQKEHDHILTLEKITMPGLAAQLRGEDQEPSPVYRDEYTAAVDRLLELHGW
ncbi:MAG: hypothetical protein N2037_10185 [Acidimicrobiales bacterium]|nr:hypothetical protein [Acidimicrobiales bacterium]